MFYFNSSGKLLGTENCSSSPYKKYGLHDNNLMFLYRELLKYAEINRVKFLIVIKKIRYSTSLVLTFVLLFYCLYASFSERIIYFIFTRQSYHFEFINATNNWFSIEENFRRRHWRKETFLYLCIVLCTNWKTIYRVKSPIFIYKLF